MADKVNTPNPQKASRRKMKRHIESYITEYESEDSFKRTVNTLKKGHSPERALSVLKSYEESWRHNPDVDADRLESVKSELQNAIQT